MKRIAIIFVAAAVGAGAAVTPVRAHHAYGLFYDLCRSVTIEGRLEAVHWNDPHVTIDLRLDDGTAYLAEWTSPRALSNRSVTPDLLKAGDRVVVTGSPMKDPALMRPDIRALVRNPDLKIVSALTQVRRPSDSWSWMREAAAPSPSPECLSK
jgi:hypothetical protein